MTEEEKKCYKTLIKIREIIKNTDHSKNLVSFRYMQDCCEDAIYNLFKIIGERVVEDENDKENESEE